MKIKDVKKYFKFGINVTRALNINPNQWTKWKKNGAIPLLRQYQIERVSKGKLKAKDDTLSETEH